MRHLSARLLLLLLKVVCNNRPDEELQTVLLISYSKNLVSKHWLPLRLLKSTSNKCFWRQQELFIVFTFFFTAGMTLAYPESRNQSRKYALNYTYSPGVQRLDDMTTRAICRLGIEYHGPVQVIFYDSVGWATCCVWWTFVHRTTSYFQFLRQSERIHVRATGDSAQRGIGKCTINLGKAGVPLFHDWGPEDPTQFTSHKNMSF